MDKELLNELDNILIKCQNRGHISMTKDTDRLTRNAIKEAEACGWIYKHNSYTYKLTPSGIDVLDFGTVEEFLLDKKSKRDNPPTPTTVFNAKNIVYGDTSGDIYQSQSSGGLRDSEINMASSPIPNATKHNPMTSPILKVWWKIIVPIIVGITVFIITKRYL